MPTESLRVDLATFTFGDTKLGSRPVESDFFTPTFSNKKIYRNQKCGIELGVKDQVLDYAFLSLDNFVGAFFVNGVICSINSDSKVTDIVEIFGEPYWIDHSDDEVIVFYEYDSGAIELQFEFPDSVNLGIITAMRNGVLSVAEQRASYNVTKPWPPEN